MAMVNGLKGCDWADMSPFLLDYRDDGWGAPAHNDTKPFEFLVLERQQAGSFWETMLRKRKLFERHVWALTPPSSSVPQRRRWSISWPIPVSSAIAPKSMLPSSTLARARIFRRASNPPARLRLCQWESRVKLSRQTMRSVLFPSVQAALKKGIGDAHGYKGHGCEDPSEGIIVDHLHELGHLRQPIP